MRTFDLGNQGRGFPQSNALAPPQQPQTPQALSSPELSESPQNRSPARGWITVPAVVVGNVVLTPKEKNGSLEQGDWPEHRAAHFSLLSLKSPLSLHNISVQSSQLPCPRSEPQHPGCLNMNSPPCPTQPGWAPSPSLTRAPHTSILLVLAVALPPGLRSTVPQGGLPAPAPHLIQPDAPISRAECRGPHGFQGLATAQLLTHHLGLCQAPGVIAHGAPGAAVPDLHPP